MTLTLNQLTRFSLVMLLAAALGGCALTRTERTALTGGAIGAAAGAGIAAVAGGPVLAGALVGTAAGAASGAIYEHRKKRRRGYSR